MIVNRPLVSVIIPCYNVEQYIDECLQSVYEQTYSNIEIICVDNDSSDATYSVLEKHKKEGKIELFSELRSGAPAARNLGLKHAKGAWIQFLDADDLLNPEKVEHQMDLIEKQEGIGFIAGAYIKYNLDGTKTSHFLRSIPLIALMRTQLGITSSNLFNAEAVKAVGGWNPNFKSSQEYELMFQIIKSGHHVLMDDAPLTIIQERKNGQISQRDPKLKWKQYVDLRISMIEYLKIENTYQFQKNKQLIEQSLFDSIRILAVHDLELANKFMKLHLRHFKPQRSEVTGRLYLFFFRLFGFLSAERIRLMIRE